MSGWISTQDRLPKNAKRVFVRWRDGKLSSFGEDNLKEMICSVKFLIENEGYFTHWRYVYTGELKKWGYVV